MSVERLIASHLRLAREALDGAGLLLDGGNRNAVYLAEQAVEQMILAVAQAEIIHFPRNVQHQLDTMIRSFPPENPIAADLFALSWLEAYATTFRYPRTQGGVAEPPPHEKLTDALKSMESLLAKLTGHFGVRLSVKDEPARTSKPLR